MVRQPDQPEEGEMQSDDGRRRRGQERQRQGETEQRLEQQGNRRSVSTPPSQGLVSGHKSLGVTS